MGKARLRVYPRKRADPTDLLPRMIRGIGNAPDLFDPERDDRPKVRATSRLYWRHDRRLAYIVGNWVPEDELEQLVTESELMKGGESGLPSDPRPRNRRSKPTR
jgi:hypothetical protein